MDHGGLKGWDCSSRKDFKSAEGREGGGGVAVMPGAEDASIYRPEPNRKHFGLTAAELDVAQRMDSLSKLCFQSPATASAGLVIASELQAPR